MRCGYVAGPYRDDRGSYYVEQNIRAAEEVGVALMKAGFAVIIPHKNTAHMDGPVSHAVILEQCLELVKRADFIVLIGDWNKSKGTMEERRVASSEGKHIYSSVKEAIEWEHR